jgi:hypothetical protein
MKKASIVLLFLAFAMIALQSCRNKEKCAAYDNLHIEVSE